MGHTQVLAGSRQACGTLNVTADFGAGAEGAGANLELEFPEPITRKKAYKRLKRVYDGGRVLSTLVGVKPEEAAAAQPGVGAGVAAQPEVVADVAAELQEADEGAGFRASSASPRFAAFPTPAQLVVKATRLFER